MFNKQDAVALLAVESLCQSSEATAEKKNKPLGLRMRSETPFQQTRCLFPLIKSKLLLI